MKQFLPGPSASPSCLVILGVGRVDHLSRGRVGHLSGQGEGKGRGDMAGDQPD